MTKKAIQDYYPAGWGHCYCCGNLNAYGHQLKNYWDAEKEQSYAIYHPPPYHSATPDFV